MSARRRVSQRDVSGRTRRSAPTRGGERSGTNGNWRRTKAFPSGAGRSPPPTEGAEALAAGCAWGVASAIQIPKRNLGRRSWASAPTPRGGTRGRHAGVVVPYGWLRRAAAIALGSGAERSVCASGREEMGGNRSRDHPQRGHQRRTIPQSRRSRDSSLSTREPLGTGDADCRVASLLAMTVLILCHSEEAKRADVGIRLFYDGRGFGPPYLGHGLRRPNSVPKFGASVKSSAPTESPISTTQASRRAAKRPRPRTRGMGENRRRGHQKGALPRDRLGSA